MKLAISNKVLVPVTLVIPGDEGRNKVFKFKLDCNRLEGDPLRSALASETLAVKAFLQEQVKGWEGQRLVLDDESNPAAFSTEAFDLMLEIAGASAVILNAYIKEVMAKEKN